MGVNGRARVDHAANAGYALRDGDYPAASAGAALVVADELRTLNLLLAGHLLHDSVAGEQAARRLGLLDDRVFEDGEG